MDMADIKWRKKDLKKLSTYIGKFNRSLTLESRKNPELADAGILPDRMAKDEVMSQIRTRSDFNRFLRRVDRWFKPKAREVTTLKSGIKSTNWAYAEARYAEQSINRKRDAILKKYNLSERSAKEIGLANVDIASKLNQIEKRLTSKARNNNTDIENEMVGWKNFVASLMNLSTDTYFDSRNQRFYDNYMSALFNHFTEEHARQIKEMVESYGLNGFQLFIATTYDDTLDIDFMYGPEQEEDKYTAIMNTFDSVMDELTGSYYER